MTGPEWIKEFPGAITVCDPEGTIVAMNDRAIQTFEKYGGAKLIGTSLYGCHPESASIKIKKIIETRATNCYTIEKQGVKKLIYQTPWHREGTFMGLVELSLEIPSEMPHFVRK